MLRRILFLILPVAVLLAACAPSAMTAPPPQAVTEAAQPSLVQTRSAPIILTDGLGRQVRLEASARRIVSLAPSNTEILFAIGAGSQVVGRDELSDYPMGVSALQSVGGSMGNFSTEAIVANFSAVGIASPCFRASAKTRAAAES